MFRGLDGPSGRELPRLEKEFVDNRTEAERARAAEKLAEASAAAAARWSNLAKQRDGDQARAWLVYTSDAAEHLTRGDVGGGRSVKNNSKSSTAEKCRT